MVGDHGWHLGMIGHGSYLQGGDKDIGIMFSDARNPITNPDHYKLPPEYVKEIEGLEEDIQTIDVDDGEADGRWMGNDVLRGSASSSTRCRPPRSTKRVCSAR